MAHPSDDELLDLIGLQLAAGAELPEVRAECTRAYQSVTDWHARKPMLQAGGGAGTEPASPIR